MNKKNQKNTESSPKHVTALFVAAFFWGTTFVAQSIGSKNVDAFTYLTCRSYIGTLFLLPFIFFRDKAASQKNPENYTPEKKKASRKNHAKAGIICGFFLFAASFSQQYGIAFTTTAKASFITTMYVVIVPVLSIFIGKKPSARIWIAVLFSVSGLYFLSIKGALQISLGDGMVMLCSVLFALEIMSVNHFTSKTDSLKLSCCMFFTVAILSTISMFIFENPTLTGIGKALPAILYAGIFSNGVAYTCQVIGQKGVSPSIASLIMCLESVFGALSGCIIQGERLSGRELLGCVLMFTAVLIAEVKLPQRKTAKQ
ncbi:MAG: DMT family transporter [Eubacterium sp.]|nr:DMT family transporter [Eubacterium sp.]